MPIYQTIIESIKNPEECFKKRQALIREIEQLTNRRFLVYVADINKPQSVLEPDDKIGFSDLIQDIKEEEVDILINSPGGFAEVTEAIVGMLRSTFKSIRFAIPNMAKSAGTLLVLSGNELLMDHRSELGPIDPQIAYPTIDGVKREAAEDILEGFDEVKKALITDGPAATPAYVPLLNKYSIGLLRSCRNAIQLSRELAEGWLRTYMFAGEPDSFKPRQIASFFAGRPDTLSHNRAIRIDKCLELGMKVTDLRGIQHEKLAAKIWEIWCLYAFHFERTPVYKMFENSAGCNLNRQSVAFQLVRRPSSPPEQPEKPIPPTRESHQPTQDVGS
jgi:hypothetical protein